MTDDAQVATILSRAVSQRCPFVRFSLDLSCGSSVSAVSAALQGPVLTDKKDLRCDCGNGVTFDFCDSPMCPCADGTPLLGSCDEACGRGQGTATCSTLNTCVFVVSQPFRAQCCILHAWSEFCASLHFCIPFVLSID